jgi:serine/threonine protein kinase
MAHMRLYSDLKPENLLLETNPDASFHLKIVDFGLGTIVSPPSALLRTACGSPCYAPPEMINGLEYVGTISSLLLSLVALRGICDASVVLSWLVLNRLTHGFVECRHHFLRPLVRLPAV